MRLSIFSYHCNVLANETPPARFSLHPCEGVDVEVRIERNEHTGEGDYYLNDMAVGNWWDAILEFTRITCKAKPEIDYT